MDMMLAKSKAGHDKGKVYFVLGIDEGYYYLADGKTKLVDKPKKKNALHVQPIIHLNIEVKREYDKLDHSRPLSDADVRKLLNIYEMNRISKDSYEM